MNKKYIYKSLMLMPLMALFAFVGCTLMMEGDEELSPEEQGFEEPVTEENEYGKFTYQYQDGVKPVTENVLEYVVESDDPNVLYFLDNIPSEWVPKVGEYLAGGCNPKIPDGLCNKVLAITHENGMYKIELGPATEDEVYKELIIEADFDYAVPDMDLVPDIDSTMTDEEKAAAVYDDWSLFGTEEEIKERYGVKSVGRNKIKKASDVVNEDKEEDRTLFELKIDTRPGTDSNKDKNNWKNIITKKISEWAKKLGIACTPYFALTYSQSSHIHYHTYHNKSTKEDEVWSEITPTNDFYLEAGIELQGKKMPFTNDAGHFADTQKLYDYYLNDLIKKRIHSNPENLKGFQRDQKGAIRVTIPAQPAIRIVMEPSIEPILTLGGCVGGHIKATGDTWRQGAKQKGSKKEPIKVFRKAGSTLVNEWFVHRYLKAGVDARFGMGLEIARSVTITVGVGAEATVELGAKTTTDVNPDPYLVGMDTKDYYSSPTYMKFDVKGYLDLKVSVSAFGLFEFWSEKMTLGTFPISKIEKSINQDITIGSAPGYLITPVVLDEKAQNIQYHFEYNVKSTGSSSVYTGKFVPRVKVYDKDKKYLFDIEANGFEDHKERTLEKKTYTFDAIKQIRKSDISYKISEYEVYFVPYLYRYSDECYLYADLATKVKSTVPMLNCRDVIQTYGGPMKKDRAKTYNLKTNEFDFEDERMCYTDFYEYRFNVNLEVQNGSLMEYMALYMKIINNNGITDKVLFARTIKKNKPKTGKYTYDIAFAIDNKTAEDDKKLLYADIEVLMKSILDKDNDMVDMEKEMLKFKNGVDNNPGKSEFGPVESTTL